MSTVIEYEIKFLNKNNSSLFKCENTWNKVRYRMNIPKALHGQAPGVLHLCFLFENVEISALLNVLNNTFYPGKVFKVHISRSTI